MALLKLGENWKSDQTNDSSITGFGNLCIFVILKLLDIFDSIFMCKLGMSLTYEV